MSERKDGGSAFPFVTTKKGADNQEGMPWLYIESGLSVCDYFAGQALTGLVAEVTRELLNNPQYPPDVADKIYKLLAEMSYGIAKQMVEVRNQ